MTKPPSPRPLSVQVIILASLLLTPATWAQEHPELESGSARSYGNAAYEYTEALTLIHKPSSEAELVIRRAVEEGWIVAEAAVLTRYMDENGPALQLFTEAVQQPSCDFLYGQKPPRGEVAPLPYDVIKVQSLGHLVILEGRRLEHQGDAEGALRTYLRLMRFGHHLGQQPYPTLIDKIVEKAVQGLAYERLAGLIQRPSNAIGSWEDTARELGRMRAEQVHLAAAFENETALQADQLFEEHFAEDVQAGKFSAARAEAILASVRSLQEEYLALFVDAAQHNSLEVVTQRLEALHAEVQQYGTIDGAAELTVATLVGRDDVLADTVAKLIMSIGLPNLTSGITSFHLGRVKYDIVATAVALRAYEHEHGGPPETLEALVPQYLAQLPEDPFDNFRPLHYVTEEAEWRLYSIGPDRRDDHGEIEYAEYKTDGKGDIVFTMTPTRQEG